MAKKKRKKLSSILLSALLIPSLILPSTLSTTVSAKDLHTSAKSELSTKNANKISSDLLDQFKKDDKVTFLIKLKDQVDTAAVSKKAAKNADKKKLTPAKKELEVRSSVVTELRSQAQSSQYELKQYLKKQEKAGNAKDIQSFYIVNGMAVTATKEVMEQVSAMPEVDKVLPNETRQLIQPVAKTPVKELEASKAPALKKEDNKETSAETNAIEWNISQIGAPQVWDMGIDGSGTVVASIDTGVQWNHPGLKEQYRGYDPANPDSPSHEFNWYDSTSGNGSTPYDDQGHGTHVTGTMVGAEPNGSNKVGVAPGAKWIAVKAFTASGGTDVDLLEAGEWILAPKDANGNPHPEKAPDVVNNSWGGGPGMDEWYRPMVQAWKAAEIFPEFSAGNTRVGNPGGPGSVANPANYPESYATGATDINNNLASFSLRGPSPYGELKPDISAPGVNIRSTVPGSGYEGGWNGTSMAGPHVSAVVALLKQVNASLTVDEIEEILETTATPLTNNEYPESPNHGFGHGLVNAFDAVNSIVDGLGKIKGSVTIEGDDSEAPTIEHEPVTESYKEMDLPLTMTASDNISIVSATLKYQKADGTWADIEASRTSGNHLSGTYSATIPAAELTTDSISYKFVVTDFAGNPAETATNEVALLDGITVGYSTDFESNPVGWTSFGTKDWEWGAPQTGPESAFSGEKVYGTNLTGNYPNSANFSLKMPPIDLPEGDSYLQFKQWYNLENNWDFGHIFVSTDGKAWTQLSRFSNLSNGWIDGQVNLSEYAGQRIYISFNLTTDGSVQRPGWFIDDVRLADTPLSTPEMNKAKASDKKETGKAKDKPAVNPDKIVPELSKPEKEKKSKTSDAAPVLLPLQAQVSVLETGRSVYTKAQDGSYELTHAAGDYTMMAEAYGYQSQTRPVTVNVDQTSNVNFTLEQTPQGIITGTVTNEQTGNPVAGATVYVVEDAAIVPAVTDEDGRYSLTVYEGTYTLKVSAPLYYGQEAAVTVEGDGTAEKNFDLKPFIGFTGEIKYDDGTAENARAFYDAGNGWAVRMSLEEGQETAQVTGASLRFWDTTWPTPGGTEFQVAVYDASGTNGAPGKKLAGPFTETALRNGNWTNVDLREHGIMVDGDFYIVYIQTKANPNAPGLGTDEDGPKAKRSWQLVGGAWSQAPEAEGNYMIRANVDYEVTSPTITSPTDGSFTNQKEVTVEGEAAPNTKVEIMNDGEKTAETTATGDGKFSSTITLKTGENELTARVTADNGWTEPSAPVTITLDEDSPELDITSPEDGSKSNRETVTVTGNVTDANLDYVKVNGQTATVKDGKYSKRILLDEGENTIEVEAKDKAGNTTEKSVKIDVKYTAPTVSNLKPDEDKILESGDTVKIEFDSEPGLDADFSILMPLTNIKTTSNATELPMRETSPGHYVGYYTATKNVVAPGAVVEVKIYDEYGNVTTEKATGKLYINKQP
ncbi:MAG: S8 family serine peptidase [Bacillus sp. (in: firmicutes)]